MILYLSNRLVQAVEIRDKKTVFVCQDMAPEGSIINGIVTDEEMFLAWIKQFITENKLPHKECSLVINSTQLNSRVLELPKIGNKELKKMIAREFADSRTENTVYTYHVLETTGGGKMQRIFAVAAEREFLEGYIRLFAQAGVEIISIEPAIANFVRRFMGTPEICKNNCIVQILDGQEIISILFVKGVYLYSQRNRIFSEDDQKALGGEAGAVVERLLQFATSQHVEDPVSTLFLCGQNQMELKNVIEENKNFTQQIFPRIYRDDKMRVKKRTGSKENVDFVYPMGGAQKTDKYADFVRQLKQESPKNVKRRETMEIIFPVVLSLAICLLITAVMGGLYLVQDSELKKMERGMQDSSVADNRASFELAQASIDSMEKKMEEAGVLWDQVMSYPTFHSSVNQVLQSCAGDRVKVEVRSFNRDSGTLALSATSGDVREVSEFVERLTQQEIFESVEYTGYTLVSGQDNYNIYVVCALAAGAGRGEAAQ